MAKQMERAVEEKKVNPVKKILYLAVIPLLFAVIVALVVATAAGINVLDEVKAVSQNIPFASGLLQKDTTTNSAASNEKDIQQLQAEIKDRDKQISQLQTKIDNQNQDLQKATLNNEQLQQQMNDLKNNQQATQRSLKDIVVTYETMSPKKAAPIISKMSDTEALQILTGIKPDALASIMENMDPAQAARFTELMTNNNGG